MIKEFAGTLDQRIRIERLGPERTDSGLSSSAWEPVLSCRAAVIAEGVGAEAEGMALSGMPRMRFLIRTSDLVAVEQRVNWRERNFLIRQVIDDPRTPDRLLLRGEEVRT